MMRYDPNVSLAVSGKHVMDLTVPCYMTDSRYRLKPSAFMTLAQEMAMNSAEILGFGHDELFPKYHLGWILSRFHFKFLKPVLWRDAVRICTWHKGVQGIFFVRDFEIVDESGEVAVLGTSSWVILNLDSRSLVRMQDLPDCVSPYPQLDESAILDLAPRIVLPRLCSPVHVSDHTVVYSDLDINLHTNNVRYVEWAMDCIDPEITTACPVREVCVNFNKETRVGDRVALFLHEEEAEDGLVFFVEGFVDGKQSFCVKLVFQQRH